MTPPPDDKSRAAMLDAAAISLGLQIMPEWRDDILFHMKLVGEAARLLEDFPLEDEIEVVSVFRP